MNSLWQAPVVVVALITWLNATPTSFADAAQREALRRQLHPEDHPAADQSQSAGVGHRPDSGRGRSAGRGVL